MITAELHARVYRCHDCRIIGDDYEGDFWYIQPPGYAMNFPGGITIPLSVEIAACPKHQKELEKAS